MKKRKNHRTPPRFLSDFVEMFIEYEQAAAHILQV